MLPCVRANPGVTREKRRPVQDTNLKKAPFEIRYRGRHVTRSGRIGNVVLCNRYGKIVHRARAIDQTQKEVAVALPADRLIHSADLLIERTPDDQRVQVAETVAFEQPLDSHRIGAMRIRLLSPPPQDFREIFDPDRPRPPLPQGKCRLIAHDQIGRDLRLADQPRNPSEMVLIGPEIVVVEKCDIRRARGLDANVVGIALPVPLGPRDQVHQAYPWIAGLAQNVLIGGSLGFRRTIVHNDDLDIPTRLRAYRLEGLAKKSRAIPRRNDDGKQRSLPPAGRGRLDLSLFNLWRVDRYGHPRAPLRKKGDTKLRKEAFGKLDRLRYGVSVAHRPNHISDTSPDARESVPARPGGKDELHSFRIDQHMSLGPFAVAAVVPPLALLPLPIVGAIIGARWPRTGLVLAGIGGILLTLLAMPVVGIALLTSLEHGFPLTPGKDDPPQAIVILGGDVANGSGTSHFGVGPLTLERLAAGSALYRHVHLPILVSGGKPFPGSDPSLAERMATVLEDEFRVPVAWQERRSANTCQNAEFSTTILARHGVKSIYLVTHAWHMRRAIFCFRRWGLSVTAAPVRLDYIPLEADQFAPMMSGWDDSYYALHEWIGIAWYHLRY